MLDSELALQSLLQSLFSVEELRRFLGFLPERDILTNSRLGPTASPEVIAHETLNLLRQHDQLARHDFWDRLIEARPQQRADIDRVRAAWMSAAAPSAPQSTAATAPEQTTLIRAVDFAALNARAPQGSAALRQTDEHPTGEVLPSPMVTSALRERYELEYLLGRGGGGRVYRARQRSTGQLVAVKLLELEADLSASARQRRKDRFRREMTICGRLAHPDIVGLIDFGELDDSLYSVFELVRGRTLAQRLEGEGALPVVQTRALMRHLLEVLIHAHGHGVVHRDIKPSNLMITGDGPLARIKVLDFGISAVPSGSSQNTLTRLTLSNEMVGTPAYAAPEQLRGDTPTPKSDLYAWGLVLFECLTGVNPMTGSSLGEIFQRQLSPAEVPIPEPLREHALGTLLRWVLVKDPARRAGSAVDVLARLEAITDGDLAALADDSGHLCEAQARPSRPHPVERASTITTPAGRVEGERRQVTALCVRLPLRSVHDDPDQALLDAYRGDLFALCKATVEEFGGVAIGGFGDLALYYFGVPRARDTDAPMAARAAIEVGERIRARSATLGLQSGVSVALVAGLHTGSLTAGDRSTGAAFAHGTVATIAIALATRSVSDDKPAINVSETFRRLMSRHGEFGPGEDRELTLDWSSKPMTVHRLIGESHGAVSGEAAMIGRDVQLAALVEAWRGAGDGPRVVLIRGEAGIGKSRLVAELRRTAREQGHGVLVLRFLPEMQHVALEPLLELITAELGLGPQPTCAGLVTTLRGFAVDLDSAVPLLCAWMSVPLEEPYAPLAFSPQKQRAMLYDLLSELVNALLRRHGSYMQIEDLHWADPSTLSWLGRWFGSLKDTQGFALMTARPDFEPRWDGLDLLELQLSPLGPGQVAAMVAALPFGEGLTGGVIAEIVARADGVPLFVEELVRVFVERRSAGDLKQVPESLRDLMMSRLDDVGAAKEVAQFAAAIGREFDVDLLLASVAGRDEATLLADLAQLVSAAIIVPHRQVGRHGYQFRHALLCDAAHASMTPAGSKLVHDAIAQALLDEFPDRVAARPDLAAYHLELAGRPHESQRYWLLAGRKATQELGYEEAQAHIRRGLDVLARCPADQQKIEAELDLLNALAAAVTSQKGYCELSLVGIYGRIAELLGRTSERNMRTFLLLWGQYMFRTVRPSFRDAHAIAGRMHELAVELRDVSCVLEGLSALCRSAFYLGELGESIGYCERFNGLRDPSRDATMMHVTGEVPFLASESFHALAQLICGRVDHARTTMVDAMKVAESLEITAMIASMHSQVAWLHLFRGMGDPAGDDLAHAIDHAQTTIALASSHGFAYWEIRARMIHAGALILRGDADGLDMLVPTLAIYNAIGAEVETSWLHCLVAEGYRLRSQFDEARASLAKARAHAEASDEVFFCSQIDRFEARLAMSPQLDEAGRAPELLRSAIARARSQGLHYFAALAAAEALRSGASADPALADGLAATRAWWRETAEGADLAAIRLLRSS